MATMEVPLQTGDVCATCGSHGYPRPQLRREGWLCMNGEWDFAVCASQGGRRKRVRKKNWWEGCRFGHRILVPFPPGSLLSGVRFVGERCVYRRSFTLPPALWNNTVGFVLLHFGAVDWETFVFVNGVKVGEHRGGCVSVSFLLALLGIKLHGIPINCESGTTHSHSKSART